MKGTSFVIDLKPYPFQVMVSFNQTNKQFQDKLIELHVNDFTDEGFYDPNCKARTVNLDTGATIVRFKDFKKDAFHYGLIAHEMFHVVEMTFKRIGLPHSLKYSSEAYAYQIQHLTEQVFLNIGIK